MMMMLLVMINSDIMQMHRCGYARMPSRRVLKVGGCLRKMCIEEGHHECGDRDAGKKCDRNGRKHVMWSCGENVESRRRGDDLEVAERTPVLHGLIGSSSVRSLQIGLRVIKYVPDSSDTCTMCTATVAPRRSCSAAR